MYDHMNNSIYNFLYDSVINTYLIEVSNNRIPKHIAWFFGQFN